ncbi:hypothetical protein BC829DRAFT_415828 [Chytridium lagenaria]|nr:hypothetical protein BC829DRAFT_415828 [Chytridium lagenaria]
MRIALLLGVTALAISTPTFASIQANANAVIVPRNFRAASPSEFRGEAPSHLDSHSSSSAKQDTDEHLAFDWIKTSQKSNDDGEQAEGKHPLEPSDEDLIGEEDFGGNSHRASASDDEDVRVGSFWDEVDESAPLGGSLPSGKKSSPQADEAASYDVGNHPTAFRDADQNWGDDAARMSEPAKVDAKLAAKASSQSVAASSMKDSDAQPAALRLKAVDASHFGRDKEEGFNPQVDAMGREMARYASFSSEAPLDALNGVAGVKEKDVVQDVHKSVDGWTRGLIALAQPFNMAPYSKTNNRVEAAAPETSGTASSGGGGSGGMGAGAYVTIGLVSGFALFGGAVGGYIWYKRTKSEKPIEIHHATDDLEYHHNPMVNHPPPPSPPPTHATSSTPLKGASSSSSPPPAAAPAPAAPAKSNPFGITVVASNKGI